MTTHHSIELLPKSDDNTEQALLKNKTFILSCSTEKKTPFLQSVLTAEEREKEEKEYDRFFPTLESFCQPDPTVGPAPFLSSREHKLVIIQSGTAVDEYIFPLGEQILGIEPLYLSVTTNVLLPATFPGLPAISAIKKVKRVFLAVCTCVEDKHGEDTQGEGRIMLFGLDYALFQDAVTVVAEGENKDTENIELSEDTLNGTTGSSGAPTPSGPGAALIIPNKNQSSEQSKFFKAIQPKLKLLWTGPGPASIVKQVGEYVLSTVSTTIYVYKLNSETMELEQVTFYFAQVHFILYLSSSSCVS